MPEWDTYVSFGYFLGNCSTPPAGLLTASTMGLVIAQWSQSTQTAAYPKHTDMFLYEHQSTKENEYLEMAPSLKAELVSTFTCDGQTVLDVTGSCKFSL